MIYAVGTQHRASLIAAALTVIKTCSFMENGPGFSDTPRTRFLGTYAAHRFPRGKVSNNGTIDLMATEGYRKEKNWLRPGIKTAHISPITHVRMVIEGMLGSSVLATAARTSGYGESSSSSSSASKSRLGSSKSDE